jgi:hypothetical protein
MMRMKRTLFAAILFLISLLSFAQLAPLPRFQFLDDIGNVCSGCTLKTYAAGTTNPIATYGDSALTVPNPTAITLNSAGRPAVSDVEVPIYIGSSSYKFLLSSATGSTLWSQDNVNDVRQLLANPTAGYGDAMIVYKAPGRGAVARTVHDRLAELETTVESYGAVGDGIHDDTLAIQNALDSGASVILLDAKTYLISATLKQPNNTTLTGKGSFSQYLLTDKIGPQYQTTVIKLADGAECNMWEPKTPDSFHSVSVKKIFFNGNRANQTTTNLYGIKVADTAKPIRSGSIFEDVYLYSIAGYGFWAGANQYEFIIRNMCGTYFDMDGFTAMGQDITAYNLAFGSANGTAIAITGGGAGRWYNIDGWTSEYGVHIYNTTGHRFYGLQANSNRKHGLWLDRSNGAGGPGFLSYIQIFGGALQSNSLLATNTFSDLYVSSHNTIAPYFQIFGMQFKGRMSGSSYPKHNIEVAPGVTNLMGNPFIGCSVNSTGVGTAAASANAIAGFQWLGCVDAAAGGGYPGANSEKNKMTSNINWNAAAGVADGGTIKHGIGTTPTAVLVAPSASGELVSVTARGPETFTIAIRRHDGSTGTTQTIYWMALK